MAKEFQEQNIREVEKQVEVMDRKELLKDKPKKIMNMAWCWSLITTDNIGNFKK